MATAVKTTVTELPESRVRVDAEVPADKPTATDPPEPRVRVHAEAPADELERSMQPPAGQLGPNMRTPGFRKGKVPPPVVIRRIGRDAVLDETVRDAIGRWYVDAVSD